MRSIFAGVAVSLFLSLGACGNKPAAGGGDGAECKKLNEKFDGWCKDAKDPIIKGFCDSQKTAVETLKKTPNEASCKVINEAYANLPKTGAAPVPPDGAGSAPTGDAAGAGSAPAEGAGSAPTEAPK